jgi:hypothetical protein
MQALERATLPAKFFMKNQVIQRAFNWEIKST